MSEAVEVLAGQLDAVSIAAPLEALLLMANDPVPTAELAEAVRAPDPGGGARRWKISPGSTTRPDVASSCASWPAGGGTGPGRSMPT